MAVVKNRASQVSANALKAALLAACRHNAEVKAKEEGEERTHEDVAQSLGFFKKPDGSEIADEKEKAKKLAGYKKRVEDLKALSPQFAQGVDALIKFKGGGSSRKVDVAEMETDMADILSLAGIPLATEKADETAAETPTATNGAAKETATAAK